MVLYWYNINIDIILQSCWLVALKGPCKSKINGMFIKTIYNKSAINSNIEWMIKDVIFDLTVKNEGSSSDSKWVVHGGKLTSKFYIEE